MNKHMDKELLREHLFCALEEIALYEGVSLDRDLEFVIVSNHEPEKKHDSVDDFMSRTVFSESNITGKTFKLSHVISMLEAPHKRFPIWVNVSLKEKQADIIVFKLEISMRFRTAKLLQFQDTKHPPFNTLKNDTKSSTLT